MAGSRTRAAVATISLRWEVNNGDELINNAWAPSRATWANATGSSDASRASMTRSSKPRAWAVVGSKRRRGGVARVAWIDDSSDARDARHDILEQPEALADQRIVPGNPRSGDIGARPRDALDQPERNGIFEGRPDQRNCLSGIVDRHEARRRSGTNHGGLEGDQFGGKLRQALGKPVAVANLQRNISAFYVSEIPQPLAEGLDVARGRGLRLRRQDTDDRPVR